MSEGERMSEAREIVGKINSLAKIFYEITGYKTPDGYRFDRATHPRERQMWHMAAVAYEEIEGTEVYDALMELHDEEGASE